MATRAKTAKKAPAKKAAAKGKAEAETENLIEE